MTTPNDVVTTVEILLQRTDVLDLPIPRSDTALMQLLQRLVGVEQHVHYCSGTCPLHKLDAFLSKIARSYPIGRNTRERAYDRKRGRAVVHMIVYPIVRLPTGVSRTVGTFSLGDARLYQQQLLNALHSRGDEATLAWWLVSDGGVGGLTDKNTSDAHVARNAIFGAEHIEWRDYVLLQAHKKVPRVIFDSKRSRSRTVLKDASTWTWKLRNDVFGQLRAAVDEYCVDLNLGAEPSAAKGATGLRGFLYAQRCRPLFSGIRTQVLSLERYARDEWRSRQKLWCALHPAEAERFGEHAGELVPLSELLATRMPKMIRLRVYDDPCLRVRDLLPAAPPRNQS